MTKPSASPDNKRLEVWVDIESGIAARTLYDLTDGLSPSVQGVIQHRARRCFEWMPGEITTRRPELRAAFMKATGDSVYQWDIFEAALLTEGSHDEV